MDSKKYESIGSISRFLFKSQLFQDIGEKYRSFGHRLMVLKRAAIRARLFGLIYATMPSKKKSLLREINNTNISFDIFLNWDLNANFYSNGNATYKPGNAGLDQRILVLDIKEINCPFRSAISSVKTNQVPIGDHSLNETARRAQLFRPMIEIMPSSKKEGLLREINSTNIVRNLISQPDSNKVNLDSKDITTPKSGDSGLFQRIPGFGLWKSNRSILSMISEVKIDQGFDPGERHVVYKTQSDRMKEYRLYFLTHLQRPSPKAAQKIFGQSMANDLKEKPGQAIPQITKIKEQPKSGLPVPKDWTRQDIVTYRMDSINKKGLTLRTDDNNVQTRSLSARSRVLPKYLISNSKERTVIDISADHLKFMSKKGMKFAEDEKNVLRSMPQNTLIMPQDTRLGVQAKSPLSKLKVGIGIDFTSDSVMSSSKKGMKFTRDKRIVRTIRQSSWSPVQPRYPISNLKEGTGRGITADSIKFITNREQIASLQEKTRFGLIDRILLSRSSDFAAPSSMISGLASGIFSQTTCLSDDKPPITVIPFTSIKPTAGQYGPSAPDLSLSYRMGSTRLNYTGPSARSRLEHDVSTQVYRTYPSTKVAQKESGPITQSAQSYNKTEAMHFTPTKNDLERISDQVSMIIERKLKIERERRGIYG
jgi:hypothetical protein